MALRIATKIPRMFVVFLAFLFVWSMAAGCQFFMPNGDDNGDDSHPGARGNTVGNIVNIGLAATDGTWIYFISNDGSSIYHIRTDGSGRERLP